jgi:hypothetical protein
VDFVSICKSAGATQADIRYDMVTAENVRIAHAEGIKVMAWFRSIEALVEAGHQDESKFFPSLVDMAVDVICTSFSRQLRMMLSGKSE